MTKAIGDTSHAEGQSTLASGNNSHAEGIGTSATSAATHSEGLSTLASNLYSHAEGEQTVASGQGSHAEGGYVDGTGGLAPSYTTASGQYSHAEGAGTLASGNNSHAEGKSTTASGQSSHAEGLQTNAKGNYSHASGSYTEALNDNETAIGIFNSSSHASDTFGDSGNTIFTVGIGNYNLPNHVRKNAFEIRQNGDIYALQKLTEDGNRIVKSTDTLADAFEAVVAKLNDLSEGGGEGDASKLAKTDLLTVWDADSNASGTTFDAKTIAKVITDNEYTTAAAYNSISGSVSSHTSNNDIHITASERTAWNAKVNTTDLGTDNLFVRGFTNPTNMNGDAPFANGDSLSTVLTKILEQITNLSQKITELESKSNTK